MINTADFKTGMTIEYENNIYQIVDFLHVKPGKGAAYVRTKLRNLRTGANVDITFPAGTKMEQADIQKINVQFLYQDSKNYVFMNMQTYEQTEIHQSRLKNEINYLYEGLEVELLIFNGEEILGITLPEKIILEVAQTEPGVKGDTKTNASKDAIMQTGLLVKVPLFIETGEKIIVSTQDGSYVSRA